MPEHHHPESTGFNDENYTVSVYVWKRLDQSSRILSPESEGTSDLRILSAKEVADVLHSFKEKVCRKFGGVNHFLQSGIKPEHNFYDHLSFQRCKTVSKMSYTCYSYFITCSLVFFFITCIQPPRRFCVTSSLISHVSKERLEFLISF